MDSINSAEDLLQQQRVQVHKHRVSFFPFPLFVGAIRFSKPIFRLKEEPQLSDHTVSAYQNKGSDG